MNKKKYLFTIQYEFEAYDNVDARIEVLKFLEKNNIKEVNIQKKLQVIYQDKQPEGVQL